jgi:hypothetical protein
MNSANTAFLNRIVRRLVGGAILDTISHLVPYSGRLPKGPIQKPYNILYGLNGPELMMILLNIEYLLGPQILLIELLHLLAFHHVVSVGGHEKRWNSHPIY